MTKEDKKLLLQDLCARLFYGVIVKIDYGDIPYGPVVLKRLDVEKKIAIFNFDVPIEYCKPYLRPMSSMTEEEKREHFSFIGGKRPFDCDFSVYPIEYKFIYEHDINSYIDWLNKHHFDFRNLIGRGLAIDCTGLNVY